MADALRALADVVRDSGLVTEGSSAVILVSGGPDSAALAAGMSRFLGSDSLVALHLNYRLRPDSGEDEAACRELCAGLGLELSVERPELPEGNLQASAREARYATAESLRSSRGLEWVATGHTRTDLVETLLYRLATSPGRRALLGLPPRRGRVVRPLIRIGRAEARLLAGEAGLPFRDDPTNLDPAYARNRIRHEVLPVLREISPSSEEAVAETWGELAEESEALDAMVEEALQEAGAPRGAMAVPAATLASLHPALQRIAIRHLAERVVGRPVPVSRGRAAEIMRLAAEPEGGIVELGSGLRAHLEHGHIRLLAAEEEIATPEVSLSVPGACRFGRWELRVEVTESPPPAEGPETALLDPSSTGQRLLVRSWRQGDRMRPLGLGGSKSLQDLFTDRKVPRSLRRTLPLVLSGERIAWVAGVAVSEEFAAGEDSGSVAVVTARQAAF